VSSAPSLGYPISARAQPAHATERMRERIAAYLQRHALFVDAPKYVDTVVHFARYCTPPSTSDEGLASACMYMAWVLYLDDIGDGSIGALDQRTLSRYCDVVRSLAEVSPAQLASPAERALAELVAEVVGIGRRAELPVVEFCERLVQLMTAQHRERERVQRGQVALSNAEYLQVRPWAIGNGAFVSIMKLDHGVCCERFDPLTRARALLLDELCTRLVYLSNDILSQHREEHDPSACSIVRVIVDATGVSWASAVERAVAVHAREVDEYMRVRDELLATGEAEVSRLVDVLDTDLSGNLAAMAFIGSRYREPDDDGPS
jgi:terpene synthase-like protein